MTIFPTNDDALKAAKDGWDTIWKAVTEELAENTICSQCGAKLSTYDELCTAPLDIECDGFRAVEAAFQRAAEALLVEKDGEAAATIAQNEKTPPG